MRVFPALLLAAALGGCAPGAPLLAVSQPPEASPFELPVLPEVAQAGGDPAIVVPVAPPAPTVPAAAPAGPVVSRETLAVLVGEAARLRALDPGQVGASAVRAARYFLSHAPSGFSQDCAGFVAATFHRVGLPIGGSPRWMWDRAIAAGALHRDSVPRAGDIAFFDDTYDRNHNGRRDDPLTHVAVVLSADPESGDIVLAHGGASHGRELLRMNLLHPSDPGRNDGLRRPTARPTGGPVLAGELCVGFATVRPADLPVWLGFSDPPPPPP